MDAMQRYPNSHGYRGRLGRVAGVDLELLDVLAGLEGGRLGSLSELEVVLVGR